MTVTLELATQHLEYDDDDRDALIEHYLDSAKSYIAGITGEVDASPVIDQAELLVIGHWFANREAGATNMVPQSLVDTICALLVNNRIWVTE